MKKIAGWIKATATDFDASKARVTEEVMALCAQHPIYAE